MKNQTKVIFHIDLNAFYGSCHVIEEPYLKDIPFIVGGSAVLRRGIVLTASYQARAFGVKSGTNVKDAMDLCPVLRVIPPNFSLYQKHSKRFFDYLETQTPLMMKASIDEAYLDMTHHDDPLKVARDIQDTLLQKFQLPCSIGIASTLFLAKMASDLKKPLGITVLRKKDIVSKLFHEPIETLYGLGRKTYPLLIDKGIITIGDFTKESNRHLILDVMSAMQYQSFMSHLYGHSTNIIEKDYEKPKSISQETTFNYPIDDADIIKEKMMPLIMEMVERANRYDMSTKTIGFKMKDAQFQTKTRSKTLKEPINTLEAIQDHMLSLFDQVYDHQPIRLIGVYMQTYQDEHPFNLFTYERFIQ